MPSLLIITLSHHNNETSYYKQTIILQCIICVSTSFAKMHVFNLLQKENKTHFENTMYYTTTLA